MSQKETARAGGARQGSEGQGHEKSEQPHISDRECRPQSARERPRRLAPWDTQVNALALMTQGRKVRPPGTVLTREWNGQTYRVMVVGEGFAWAGRTYDSLSKIASAITGTRWNGPRFFGLRDRIPAEVAS